jgi:hypothetical protein
VAEEAVEGEGVEDVTEGAVAPERMEKTLEPEDDKVED